MVPCSGTLSVDDRGSFNYGEFSLDSTPTCFEIVHFAFQGSVPRARQTACMRQIGDWARLQPGFVARQSYHDPHANRWTDVVEWSDLAHAQAAMERSQREASLAEILALIDPVSLQVGHCERLIQDSGRG